MWSKSGLKFQRRSKTRTSFNSKMQQRMLFCFVFILHGSRILYRVMHANASWVFFVDGKPSFFQTFFDCFFYFSWCFEMCRGVCSVDCLVEEHLWAVSYRFFLMQHKADDRHRCWRSRINRMIVTVSSLLLRDA